MGCVEQLRGFLRGELVGKDVFSNRGGLLASLQIRTVFSDTHHDRLAALWIKAKRNRIDLYWIDFRQLIRDGLLEAEARFAVLVMAEVEAGQPWQHLFSPRGNLVKIVLHRSSEVVVNEFCEVLFEELDHSEGGEGGDQRRTLLPDIPAVLNGRDDTGVGGGPADAELFHLLHQTGIGVAGRGLRGV